SSASRTITLTSPAMIRNLISPFSLLPPILPQPPPRYPRPQVQSIQNRHKRTRNEQIIMSLALRHTPPHDFARPNIHRVLTTLHLAPKSACFDRSIRQILLIPPRFHHSNEIPPQIRLTFQRKHERNHLTPAILESRTQERGQSCP